MKALMFAVVAIVAALTVSCSVTGDETPRDIESNAIGIEADPAGAELRAVGADRIYLVVDLPGLPTRIEPVHREVGGDLTRLTAALVAGPTSSEFIELYRSAIPTTLVVNNVSRIGPRVVVDLSGEIQSLSSDVLVLALAQIVYTVLDIAGVTAVVITLDGQGVRWPTSTGDFSDEALSVFDFPNLEVTRQPAYPSIPSI